jgi:phosphinothricin acetyltransferase
MIRAATAADVPAMRDLFNALIPTRTITWRDHLAPLEEIEQWFADQHRAGNPVFVAEHDGEVVGYTTWTPFRGGPRFPGYAKSVELTIHVRTDQHGRGVGRSLIDRLLDEARRRDLHAIIAGVDGENHESIAFHSALGFVEVARMPEVGRKFDRWLDLVFMQRILPSVDA